MAYQATEWVNDKTPINEHNMNHIEEGVSVAHFKNDEQDELLQQLIEFVQELDARKVDSTVVSSKITEHNESSDAHNDLRIMLRNRPTFYDVENYVTEGVGKGIAQLTEDNEENIKKIKALIEWINQHEEDASTMLQNILQNINAHTADNISHISEEEHVKLTTHLSDIKIHVTEEQTSAWNAHAETEEIHVTSEDKSKWNNAASSIHTHDASEIFKVWDDGTEEGNTESLEEILEDFNERIWNNDNELHNEIPVQLKGIRDDVESQLNGFEQVLQTLTNDAREDAIEDAHDYTDEKIAALVGTSDAALDTLQELADALGNDPNFATTVLTAIGNKADASHNHDNIYATKAHEHSGYALTTHNHDTVYAKKSHNHDERYDERYAEKEHTHEEIGPSGTVITDVSTSDMLSQLTVKSYNNFNGIDKTGYQDVLYLPTTKQLCIPRAVNSLNLQTTSDTDNNFIGTGGYDNPLSCIEFDKYAPDEILFLLIRKTSSPIVMKIGFFSSNPNSQRIVSIMIPSNDAGLYRIVKVHDLIYIESPYGKMAWMQIKSSERYVWISFENYISSAVTQTKFWAMKITSAEYSGSLINTSFTENENISAYTR